MNNVVTPDPASIKISIKTQDDRDCVKSASGVVDAWKAWPDLHTSTFKCNRVYIQIQIQIQKMCLFPESTYMENRKRVLVMAFVYVT